MEKEDIMSKEEIKRPFIEKIVDKIQLKGFTKIRAKLEEHDDPKTFRNLDTDRAIVPDVSAVKYGRKHYFEVAIKSDAIQKVVNKWKLLSQLAAAQQGKLHLFTPYGHKAFTQRLLDSYNINAEVAKI